MLSQSRQSSDDDDSELSAPDAQLQRVTEDRSDEECEVREA